MINTILLPFLLISGQRTVQKLQPKCHLKAEYRRLLKDKCLLHILCTRQKFYSVTWKFQYFSNTKQYPENPNFLEKVILY